MKKYEYTGKTYDDAKEQALSELKVAEENLIITILEEKNTLLKKSTKISVINYNDVIESHIRNHADITLVYKHVESSESDEIVTDFKLKDGRIVGVNKNIPVNKGNLNVFINIFVMKKSLLQNIVMDSISHNKHHFMADVISENLDSLSASAPLVRSSYLADQAAAATITH